MRPLSGRGVAAPAPVDRNEDVEAAVALAAGKSLSQHPQLTTNVEAVRVLARPHRPDLQRIRFSALCISSNAAVPSGSLVLRAWRSSTR